MASMKGFDLFNTNKKGAAEETPVAEPAVAESVMMADQDMAEEEGTENLEIRVVRPKRVDEAEQIANYLLSGCLVFLNLESTDKATSRRLIDYLQGAIYVLKGELQRVSSTAFILSPSGVEISGAVAAESAAKTEEPKTVISDGFGDL